MTKRPVVPSSRETTLGLDISSVCVGYAIFDNLDYKTHGKFIQQGEHHGERLHNFSIWLEELFNRYQPTNVVVELPHGGFRAARTYIVLSMYLAILMAQHYKVFQRELPKQNQLYPKSVKSELALPLSGDHDTNKRIMVDYVNKVFRLSLRCNPADKTKQSTDDDSADAIGLTVAWLLRSGRDDGRYDSDQDRIRKRAKKAARNRS